MKADASLNLKIKLRTIPPLLSLYIAKILADSSPDTTKILFLKIKLLIILRHILVLYNRKKSLKNIYQFKWFTNYKSPTYQLLKFK